MWKKCINVFVAVLWAVWVVPYFFSCSDDEREEVPAITMNAPRYESVSGKYEITDWSSPYESIELGASGDYLVMKRGADGQRASSVMRSLFSNTVKVPAGRAAAYGNLIYGSFTQLDPERFSLEGFGVIRLKAGGQGVTDIVITPRGGSEMTFSAEKVETMGDDELTNALCRTWKVVKTHEKGKDAYDGEYDETYTPDEVEEALSEVMFTKSGTFLSLYNDREIEAHFWKWENQGARQVRASWDNVWNNGGDESVFAVDFSSGNRLVIYEHYVNYETDEWSETTVELTEKNPSGNGGDEGEANVPADTPPVGRVFTGKLVDEVDDHGLDKFVYENGFLTRVLSGEGEEYEITFEYNYLDPEKSASEPDVRYTQRFSDGRVNYVYEVWLDESGFAGRVDSRHYDENGELDFSFQSTCGYDKEGHLVYLSEGREEREYSLVWEDGDLVHVEIQGSHARSTDFIYAETPNSNNLMFFYDVYDMDIEELKYLYWAGLLGRSPRHLATMSDSYDENHQFRWEAGKVSYRRDNEEVWSEAVRFSFAD